MKLFVLGAALLLAALQPGVASARGAHHHRSYDIANDHDLERGYHGDHAWTQPGVHPCAIRGTCRSWRPDYKRFICSAHTAFGGYYEASASTLYKAQMKALDKCHASKGEGSCTATACWQADRP